MHLTDGGPKRKLVGLEMVITALRAMATRSAASRRSDRLRDQRLSVPLPKKNIALAYVPVDRTAPGTEVAVEVRGNLVKAKVVPTPFYRRSKNPVQEKPA